MTGSGGTYLTVLAGCLVLSGAISLGIRFAAVRKTKLPDKDRDGQSPNKLASVAIVVSFICVVPLSSLINPLTGGTKQLDVILIATGAIFVAGLAYQYLPLPQSWCFGVDLAGGLIVWTIGNGIELQNQLPNYVAFVLTILWFLLIPSGFRLIDERDGMVLGVASLICLTFFILALTNGQVLLAALSAALTGSSLGFLVVQPNSVRLKLGNGGASAIGFLVAFFALMLYSTGNFVVSALVPLLTCSFVLLNAVMSVLVALSRIGGSFELKFIGMANQLQTLGYRTSMVNLVIHIGVGVTGLLTVAMYVSDPGTGRWIAGLTVVLHVIAGTFMIYKTRRYKFDDSSPCL